MHKIKLWRKYLKNKPLFKLMIIALVACAGFFAWAKISSGAVKEFAQADDVPRGALVYAQFQDLPALLKSWDESDLKRQYLVSQNFSEFQNRHLALKLVSRWQEFNDALGFEFDQTAFAAIAENRVAVAIYDVGKMKMVLVAPVSDEKFAATMFFQNQEQYEQTTLPDKTIYYSREVAADRGRQKQKILFANLNGRFVLATDETLLLRTLANINQTAQKDRLSDEPDFSALSERITPHLATVWVDQAKLNEDWYFKHYWLMRNIADLKFMRSGIFDFEMQNQKIVERRDFLRAAENSLITQPIPAHTANRLQLYIPAEIPFFKLQALEDQPQESAKLLRDTILDRSPQSAAAKSGAPRWNAYDGFEDSGADDASDDDRYSSLGSNFDAAIDEDDQNNEQTAEGASQGSESAEQLQNGLQKILIDAGAVAAVTAVSPQTMDAPRFISFRRATIFSLNSPAQLDAPGLEAAVSAMFVQRLAVAGENFDVSWSEQIANNQSWRKLKLPFSDQEVCYAKLGGELIVTNSEDFLKELLANSNALATNEKTEETRDSFSEQTIVRFDRRETVFDAPFKRLVMEETGGDRANLTTVEKTAANDFFGGNLGSLFKAAHQLKQIEIRRFESPKFLTEEVVFVLQN